MTNPARAFAMTAHGDQKYGEHPYVFHLDQVAGHLADYGELAQTIGYLHDVVEDTPVTCEAIAEAFGALVAECVGLLSDEPGANRKERKAKTYEKLSRVTGPAELALVVKVADRLANVKACVADSKVSLWKVYQGEHAAFRAAAYRTGQCDALWLELDLLLQEGILGTDT